MKAKRAAREQEDKDDAAAAEATGTTDVLGENEDDDVIF